MTGKNQEFARIYAQIAHDDQGQKRRSTGNRYWVHPESVADILESLDCPEYLCAAAEMHDLLEDTDVTWENISELFGQKVANIVSEVTTDKKEKEKYGKELALDREMLELSNDALTLKLADQLYNYSDHADVKQKKRIQHHIDFIKRNRKLTSIHKELIEMLESMFDYI
jgi:(p)ppGpp synthase/HD superfamily hydrolase